MCDFLRMRNIGQKQLFLLLYEVIRILSEVIYGTYRDSLTFLFSQSIDPLLGFLQPAVCLFFFS